MSCSNLLETLGYACREVGGGTILVQTPFTFSDGELIHFYLQESEGSVLVHDNADTLSHLAGIGWDVSTRKRWLGIRSAISSFGFNLEDSGVIMARDVSASKQQLIARYVASLLAVSELEREYLGLSDGQIEFVEEVEACLRVIYQTSDLKFNPSAIGHSGKSHTFHFSVDGKLVDAMRPNGRSTGALLRKVLDVANTGADKQFMVVVDDREDEERAKAETDILSTTVSVMQFSALEKQAARSSTRH